MEMDLLFERFSEHIWGRNFATSNFAIISTWLSSKSFKSQSSDPYREEKTGLCIVVQISHKVCYSYLQAFHEISILIVKHVIIFNLEALKNFLYSVIARK